MILNPVRAAMKDALVAALRNRAQDETQNDTGKTGEQPAPSDTRPEPQESADGRSTEPVL